jgi:hypothetical protein
MITLEDLTVELEKLYELGESATTANDIQSMMSLMTDVKGLSFVSVGTLKKGQTNSTDIFIDFLKIINVDKLSMLSNIMFLRTLCHLKEIDEWNELKEKVKSHMVNNNIEIKGATKTLLYGNN